MFNYSIISIKELINHNLKYTNPTICSDRLSKLTNKIIFNHLPFTPIYIANFNKKQYILDGHHRFKIYKDNKDNNYLINKRVPIIDIFIKDLSEINMYYNIINDMNFNKEFVSNNIDNNMEIDDIKMEDMEIRENIINSTYQHYLNKNVNSFKYNGNRRPYLCKSNFLKELDIVYENNKKNINSIEDLISLLDNLNNKYKKQKIEWYPSKGKINNMVLIEKIKNDNMLYFGMFPNEWYQHIHNFPKINSEKKISQTLRQHVWFKYANNKLETKCNCCGINTINAFTFECGHIIPASKGGECHINNLVPICGLCNKSMGNINMITFLKNHDYPINKLIK